MDLSRNALRRAFALWAFVAVQIIVAGVTSGLAFDGVANRMEKVWPPLAVIFPALIGFLIAYMKIGSDETRHGLDAKREG